MIKKVLATAMFAMGLFPSLLFGQNYRIDVDLQSSGEQVVIDRVFTGNTVGLEANFYDGTNPFPMTNWTTFFRYGYGQYDTNGMVPIAGVATSNKVVFESATNLFFSPSENYYFSIAGVDSSGRKRTFARGRLIEEYDPGTAGTSGVISNGQYYISWASIYGDPSLNSNLVSLIALSAGADAVARAGVASNSASIISVGAVASNALPASATNDLTLAYSAARGGFAGTETIAPFALTLGGVTRSNFAHSVDGAHVWVDASTNYYAMTADTGKTFSSTSFSSTLMWALTNQTDNAVVTIGNVGLDDGKYVSYEIDAPIAIGGGLGLNGFTIRGQGNLGTHVLIKSNYTGRLFVLTNMVSISRFENIRFQDAYLTANTNPCIYSEITEIVVNDCEFTGFLGEAIKHWPSFYSAWNKVADSWFVRTRGPSESERPSISLKTTVGTTFVDFQISDCHFWQQGGTNAGIKIEGPRSLNAQIHGCRFYCGDTNATDQTIIELAGGTGAMVSDNSFCLRGSATVPVRFTAESSNDYAAIVSGNNFAPRIDSPLIYGANTNSVVVGTNSHNIQIAGNKLGASTVQIGTGSGRIWNYNGYDDSLSASSLVLGTNAAVSNWPASGGGIDEADAGQIATNVASARVPLSGGAEMIGNYMVNGGTLGVWSNAQAEVRIGVENDGGNADECSYIGFENGDGLGAIIFRKEGDSGKFVLSEGGPKLYGPWNQTNLVLKTLRANIEAETIKLGSSNLKEDNGETHIPTLALADGFVTVWSTNGVEQLYNAVGVSTVRFVKVNTTNLARHAFYFSLTNFATTFQTSNVKNFSTNGMYYDGRTNVAFCDSPQGSSNFYWKLIR